MIHINLEEAAKCSLFLQLASLISDFLMAAAVQTQFIEFPAVVFHYITQTWLFPTILPDFNNALDSFQPNFL